MVGRGTRLHPQSEKISFKIYDYTNATRLFGEDFLSKQSKPKETLPLPPQPPIPPPPPPEPPLEVTGLPVTIIHTDPLFMIVKDDKHTRVSFVEYRDHVKGLILERLPTVDDFVQEWLDDSAKLLAMPSIQTIIKRKDEHYDSFDVLADLIYEVTPKTKHQRLADFLSNNEGWLITMPEQSANTLRALGEQFEIDGTEGINNGELFNVQRVKNASGGNPFKALGLIGKPNEVVRDFKARIFHL
jgi:type I restriction enzyme R subunit